MKRQKLVIVLFSTLLLVILILGCAGTKPPAWGSMEEGILLSYRSDPGSMLQYKSASKNYRAYERGGNSNETEFVTNYRFHLTTVREDSLLTFVVTVDSLARTSISSRGEEKMDFGEIAGKRARVTMAPSGALRDITAIDSISQGRFPGKRQHYSDEPARSFLYDRGGKHAYWTTKHATQRPPSRAAPGGSLVHAG